MRGPKPTLEATLLCLCLILAVPEPATAQIAERVWGAWGNFAVGFGVPYALGFSGSLAIRRERVVVRARWASASEFLGNYREDVGVLVGVVASPGSRRGQVVVGAGLGRAGGYEGCVLCGSRETATVWGLLFDVEWSYSITNFFGVMAYGFTDLNSYQSFGGGTLGFYLGRF